MKDNAILTSTSPKNFLTECGEIEWGQQQQTLPKDQPNQQYKQKTVVSFDYNISQTEKQEFQRPFYVHFYNVRPSNEKKTMQNELNSKEMHI